MSEFRKCNICGEMKPFTEEHFQYRWRNGELIVYGFQCRKCRNVRAAKAARERSARMNPAAIRVKDLVPFVQMVVKQAASGKSELQIAQELERLGVRGPRKKAGLGHIPAEVTKARNKVGLTKRALAKLVGISEQLMGDIESGRRSATPANLMKIAEALSCPLDTLKYFPEADGTG